MAEHYYITERDTVTGQKFAALDKKIKAGADAIKVLMLKYGIDKIAKRTFTAFGGVSKVDFPKGHKVDRKLWTKVVNGYVPSARTNEGKAIQAEIYKLPTISRDTLNAVIGWRSKDFEALGFCNGGKKYYGFITNDTWKVKIPADCREVTLTEWKQAFKLKQWGRK